MNPKTVFIHFTHKFENEEYQAEAGKARILECLREGYPIRSSFYDPEENVIYVTFGCKGAVIEND